MSWDYDDAQERKEELRRELTRRKKKGEVFTAFEAPAGRKLTHTFWGQAWCRHLESYADYEYRLPRGRSYLRQGHVYNLEITPGRATAAVAGSELYEVAITLPSLKATAWKKLKKASHGQVASLLDLLSGTLGDGVMKTITDPKTGLFPTPREIRLSCTCPDHADLCKHCAAVLYGVGVLFDRQPDLFFVLRGVDPAELITASAQTLSAAPSSSETLADADLGDVFGIEMGPNPEGSK